MTLTPSLQSPDASTACPYYWCFCRCPQYRATTDYRAPLLRQALMAEDTPETGSETPRVQLQQQPPASASASACLPQQTLRRPLKLPSARLVLPSMYYYSGASSCYTHLARTHSAPSSISIHFSTTHAVHALPASRLVVLSIPLIEFEYENAASLASKVLRQQRGPACRPAARRTWRPWAAGASPTTGSRSSPPAPPPPLLRAPRRRSLPPASSKKETCRSTTRRARPRPPLPSRSRTGPTTARWWRGVDGSGGGAALAAADRGRGRARGGG